MGKILREFWPSWAAVILFTFLVAVFVVRGQPSKDPCPMTWEWMSFLNSAAVEEGYPSATIKGMQEYQQYYCDMRQLRDFLTKENYPNRASEYRSSFWELNYLADRGGITRMQDWGEPTEEQLALWFDVRTVAEYLGPEYFSPEDPDCPVEHQNSIGECVTVAETPFGTIQLSWELTEDRKSLRVFNESFQFERWCNGEFVPDTFAELFECPLGSVSYHIGYNYALDCYKLDAGWHDIGLVTRWDERSGKTCDVDTQILPDNIDEIIAASTK